MSGYGSVAVDSGWKSMIIISRDLCRLRGILRISWVYACFEQLGSIVVGFW